MGKFDWKSVKKEDVEKAIRLFLSENPEYSSPRSTFLLYDGKRLPAKHIRGMAYKVANSIEVPKSDYAGGMETVRFFERLGFEVYYTGAGKHQFVVVSDKEVSEERKAVPEKQVIVPKQRKNALQLILNRMFDGDIVCEKTYPWLKTPEVMEGEYAALYSALSGYRGDKKFAKKNVVLRCDFVRESKKLIIEYDERQHFSEARKVSLNAYRNVPLQYDRELWISACGDIQAKDNQPANRDEVRAYYDSTRDIEAARHGYKLVRIMHGRLILRSPKHRIN